MRKLVLIAAGILLAGCSPQIRVYSDHDPEYQVSNFKTFDWGLKSNVEANKNPLHYNELNDKRIKSAVLAELSSRGYSLSSNSPDLIVHYHIIVDEQSVVTTEPYGYIYGSYWRRMQTHVYSYREGSLIIDLMDPKSNSLVWRGWATADLNLITPEKAEDIIKRGVHKIFRNFPTSDKTVDAVVSNANRK
ncbi:MAG TPA: DUF4136 domain-containing protein [Chryseosolibacter sp.]